MAQPAQEQPEELKFEPAEEEKELVLQVPNEGISFEDIDNMEMKQSIVLES